MQNPVLDLGEIDHPLLIFGGPYSNLAATEALFEQARKLGVSNQHCICTGDVVAYCAEAEQTSQLIRKSSCPVVMGNCEQSLATNQQDCGCGFEQGMLCSTLSEQWFQFANAQISDQTRHWMSKLPSAITFTMKGYRSRVIHGSAQQINRFIFHSTAVKTKQQQMQNENCELIIGGHCGLPFGQKIDSGGWLNAGAIGLPANDGTCRVWYMLLTPDTPGITVSWHSLAYEASKTYQSMMNQGLTEYAQTIHSGLWPSMDILPEIEQSRRGKKLYIEAIHFPVMN